ncbi:MAG: hypothetical protein PHI40_07370, partial [Caldisericia bacterium]|nr:hypothetical protein [Caldisericia bacterium]
LDIASQQKKRMDDDQKEKRWTPEQKDTIAKVQSMVYDYFTDKNWMDFAKTTNSLSDFDQKCTEIVNTIRINSNVKIAVEPIEQAPKILREQNTTCKRINDILRNLSTSLPLRVLNGELPSLLKKWNSLKILSIRWHDEEVSKVRRKLLLFVSEYVHSNNFQKELSVLQKKYPDSNKDINSKIRLLEELIRSLQDESLAFDLETIKKSFSIQSTIADVKDVVPTTKSLIKDTKPTIPKPVDISPKKIPELVQKQYSYDNLAKPFSLVPVYPFVGFFSTPFLDKHPLPKTSTPPQNPIMIKPQPQRERIVPIPHQFLLNAASTRIKYPIKYDVETEKEHTYPSDYLQEIKNHHSQVLQKHIETLEKEMEELIPSSSFHINIDNLHTMIQWIEENESLSYLEPEAFIHIKTRAQKTIDKILLNEQKTNKLFDHLQITSDRFHRAFQSVSPSIVKMTMNTLKKYTEALRSEKIDLQSLQSDIEEILLDPYTSHYTYKYLKYKKNQAFKKICILEELLEKAKIHHNNQIQKLFEQNMCCSEDIEKFIEKCTFYQKFSDHGALLNSLNPLFEEMTILQKIKNHLSTICSNHQKASHQMTLFAKEIQHHYPTQFTQNIRLRDGYNILFVEWIDKNINSAVKKKMYKHTILLKKRNENDKQ